MRTRSDDAGTRMHLGRLRVLSSLLAGLLFATACTGTGNAPSSELNVGPQAWVEFPYEGSTLPMEPVTLVVYASDVGGVSHIQAAINGQALPGLAVAPMTTDGSTRLARADYSWQPPAEGEYVVEAVGVGANGTTGQASSTKFCVVTCRPATAAQVAEATPTPSPGPSPTPSIGTASPQPSGDVAVEFYASPPYVNAGNCTTLHWEVIGSETVYFNGAPTYFRGMEERCPCETESHTLNVTKPDGSAQDYYVTIEAYGSCTAPPVEPPPPSDTTGPSINAVYAFWEGCTIYGQADLSDPSGVSSAEFSYNLNGQGWSSIPMSQSGGLWTSTSGVSVSDGLGTPEGNLVYKVRAVDSAGNESWSGDDTLGYLGCGGNQ
jgi:hypothetical protein